MASVVNKVSVEAEQTLVISIEYSDGMLKTRTVGTGDYISVAFNKNGMRRCVNGTVTYIKADVYNPKVTKNDWYIVVANDEDSGLAGTVRISVVNIIDIEVLRKKNFTANVTTPNNCSRVTTIRVKANVLQVSCNNGRTWMNVGELYDGPVGEEINVEDRVRALIGSDQYATSDEFVKLITEIIMDEVRRLKNEVSGEEADDISAVTTAWDDSSAPKFL